jgi:signal transduction histidine kinase
VDELRARVANQVSARRARELLQRELASSKGDLAELAREVTFRKHELESVVASLRIAHEQAERALRVKADFLSLASHELRTPLTTLLLNIDQLRRADPAADRRQVIAERLRESARRLSELVDSLLEYARIERGRLSVVSTEVDLPALCEAVLAEHRPQAAHKQLALVLRVAPALAPAQSDPRLLRLVLSNLVGNAVKFTSEGRVDVELGSDGCRHRLRVRDTGPGIAAEDLPRIFEPWSHLEPLRGKHTPGFGLGLALCRQMARALGGEIEVDSKPGGGSAFTLTLPPLALLPAPTSEQPVSASMR